MELRVLKYFLAVAREENITKAADFLHITQPTLSRQMMQLEDELNTILFVRGKNHLVLTDEGMLLRRRAQEIVDLADKTENEFLQHDQLISGDVFIGGGETHAMLTLAEIIRSFHEQYPQVKYHLFSGNADDVKDRIDKGLIDIGLLTEPVDITKYDFIRLPQKDNWGVLMRKDSPLAHKEYITPKDLAGQSILCSRRTMVQNELASWFGKYYQDIDIVSTYNLIYNATLMVETGMGYAVCLENLVYTNKESSLCFKRFQPLLTTGNVVVWKKHQVFSPATSRFIETLRKTIKED